MSTADENLPANEPAETGDESVILRYIAELPPKQKAAFIMIEIEDHSSQEAARMLGCSDSTVRVHLARAKARLRKWLSEAGLGHE